MLSKLALLTVAALAAAPACAQQELVQNGGFETGDFTGWTEFGETDYNSVWDGEPNTGLYSAYFGPLSTGGIEQVLTANIGDHVTVSFWYVSESGSTPNSILVTLGSLSLLSQSDITSTVYQHFTADVTIADLNPVLHFEFSDPPDYIDLDDVSVILSPGSTCGSADFDCDGDVGTDADIEAFFACLAGNCPAPPCTSTADFNGDGDVGTDMDIEAFFRVLAGGTC